MKQKQQPVIFLQSKRLYLRSIENSDLETCQRWMNDPDVRQFIIRQTPMDLLEEQRWHENRSRGRYPADITFAIVLRHDHRHIGNTGIHQIDWINRACMTGAVIGESRYRNNGYGSEAKELVLEYAFDALNMNRVGSCVLATNTRSLAYLKKTGYQLEGTARECIWRNGRWIDEYHLGILESEWRKRCTQKKR